MRGPIARARRHRLMVAGVAGGLAALLCGVLVQPSSAVNLRTDLFTETFQGGTTSTAQWALPSPSSNNACLTVGTSAAAQPIKGCVLGARADAAGSGTLRLTSSGGTLAGSVFSTTGVPLAQGLDVRFNSYQWNGSGADGISFVLAATDPADPRTPAVGGATGEGLGYATARGTAGVSYGYLGLGLDVYGNFAQTAGATANGCGQASSPVRTPSAITVRGPGNGTTGYCVLGTPRPVTGRLDKPSATTRPVPVPVEVAINPSSTATTTTSGLQVPARSWAVQVKPYANGTTGDGSSAPAQTVTGALPSAAATAPAGWTDPTGMPHLVTFGWSGSTGGSTETHEVSGFTATTLNGPLPVYSLSVADDQNGRLAVGADAAVTLTPRLSPDDGAEAPGVPVTVRAAFPSGITPRAGTFATNGYSCTTTGGTVACTYTPTSAIPAGTELPAAVIPVTGASAGLVSIDAGVSSRDANPAVASAAVTVTAMTAQAQDVAYGTDVVLTASGLSGAATGTVAFADASGPLCTATLPARSCTATRPAAGTHVVTATWRPTSGPSISATTSFQVARAGSAGRSMTVAPATTPWGTGALVTATGLDPAATGTIAFRTVGGAALCSAALPATSCITDPTIPVGAHDIEAQYSGDANHVPSVVGTSYTVAKRTAVITASSSSASTGYGTPVTLSVAGLPTSGPGAATGTVEFRTASGTVLCTATLPAPDCTTPSALPVGTLAVTASYSGDAHGLAAQSGPVPLTVTRAAVTLSAGPDGGAVAHGGSIPLTVAGLPADATGTVTFRDGNGRVLCSFDAVQDPSCGWTADVAAGPVAVTAGYDGDGSFSPAVAAPFTVQVLQAAAPTFSAHVAAQRIPFGTAEVLSFLGLPADATGSVRFDDASGVLCTVPDVTRAASCRTARDLPVGDREVTATYSGDAATAGATATTGFRVTRASTAVTAAVAIPSVAFGTAAQLIAGALPAGATGTVRFVDRDGDLLCAVRLSDGRTCTTADHLNANTYRVTAAYSGDDRYSGSSDTTSFTVAPAATRLTAAAATASLTVGTRPVLTVSGLDLRGEDAATGTVTFRTRSGTVLCSVTLPGTSCTATTTLPVGTSEVLASYSGDSNHSPSTDSLRVTATRDAVTLSVRARTAAIEPGSAVLLIVAGLPDDAEGLVRIQDGDSLLCTITLPGDRCEVQDARWAPGRNRLTARYSGDDDRLPATATTSVLVRQPARATEVVTASTGGDGRLTASVPVVPTGDARILQQPDHGTVTLVDGAWRYRGTDPSAQSDRFTYRIVREDGTSKVVTVVVRGGRLAETGSAVVAPIGIGAALLGAGLLLLAALALARRWRKVRP